MPRHKAGKVLTRALVALGILGALGAGGYYLVTRYQGQASASESALTAVVTRGRLVVSVTEAGEIEAENKKVITNEINREAVIKDLVDEGTRVKKGQVIIEFESQQLLDQIEEVRGQVAANETYFTEARENRIMRAKELAHAVTKAKESVRDAEEALVRYVEGEAPLAMQEMKSRVSLAERDLLLAQEKLDFKLRVNANPELKSPYSQNEIKAEELSVARLELSKEQAESDLKMLNQYDQPRQIRILKANVTDAKLDLERAEMNQRTQNLINETKEKSREQDLVRSKQKLKELLEEEQKLVITAEADGLVAYDTGQGWRAEQTTVAKGESIRPRQQLMIIPDMTSLQVRTRVYEAVISMLEVGQPATIRLDSRPEQPISGRVKKVDVLPSSQHRWLNPGVKVFDVVVGFDSNVDLENFKPGLTAQVQIELARLDNVLSVPIAAVYTQQETTFCHVLRNDQAVRTPIKVGRMNDARVEILSGVSEGDEVLLVTPTSAGSGGASEEETDATEAGPAGEQRGRRGGGR